jgi:pre-mRNA-processing factor 40
MLEESKVLTADSKYYDVSVNSNEEQTARYFMSDPRYRALEDREREELFQDYLDDLEKKEKEEQRVAAKQRADNLRSLFEEQKVPLDTSWEKCQELFTNNSLFKAADDLERLT